MDEQAEWASFYPLLRLFMYRILLPAAGIGHAQFVIDGYAHPDHFFPSLYPRWVSLCLAFIWLASSLTLKIQAGTGWSEIFVTSAIAATSITAILISSS
jgi:hypothetical protein